MMIFYCLTLIDLVGRLAIMISLNFRPFFAMEILVISVVCLELALFVGASNAWILTSLTIDLKTLKCQSKKELGKVKNLSLIYTIFLCLWTACLVASAIIFLFVDKYEYIMLMETIMFSVQAMGLLIINADLHKTLSSIFGQA